MLVDLIYFGLIVLESLCAVTSLDPWSRLSDLVMVLLFSVRHGGLHQVWSDVIRPGLSPYQQDLYQGYLLQTRHQTTTTSH